jgi:hypothetical protein
VITVAAVVCLRCGHPYAWRSLPYPSAENVRRLGAEVREHYAADHPGDEVGR